MDKNIRVGVISSIFSTLVFIYFLDPILRFTSKLFISFFSHISSSYVDRMYTEAGLGYVSDPTIILALWTIFSLFLVLAVLAFYKILITFRLSGKFLIVFALFYVFLFLSATSTASYKFGIQTTFHTHMHVLGPYISAKVEKELWHDWASMRSKRDYEKIRLQQDKIAATNGFQLSDIPVTVPF